MLSIFQPDVPQAFSSDEAFDAFVKSSCDHLTDGTSRAVHIVRNAELVVKVALDHNKIVCNWIEVVAFFYFRGDQNKLARIVSWSRSCRFIVMEKLDTSIQSCGSFIPPAWVTDTGLKNGGVDVDGNYKLCDYAFVKSPDEAYRTPYV